MDAGIPNDLKGLIAFDVIVASSGILATLAMAVSELAGLGWNPLIVYGCVVLTETLMLIGGYAMGKRKG